MFTVHTIYINLTEEIHTLSLLCSFYSFPPRSPPSWHLLNPSPNYYVIIIIAIVIIFETHNDPILCGKLVLMDDASQFLLCPSPSISWSFSYLRRTVFLFPFICLLFCSLSTLRISHMTGTLWYLGLSVWLISPFIYLCKLHVFKTFSIAGGKMFPNIFFFTEECGIYNQQWITDTNLF